MTEEDDDELHFEMNENVSLIGITALSSVLVTACTWFLVWAFFLD